MGPTRYGARLGRRHRLRRMGAGRPAAARGAGRPVATARPCRCGGEARPGVGSVVGTWRSAPRPPGACMFVGPDKSVVGSVSGGCVEGAVYELAGQVVA